MRTLILVALLATGCSKVFGFDSPQLREDAGVEPIDGPSDAAPDGPVDAGIDAPAAVGSFGVQTTNNSGVSFVGGFAIQKACNSTNTVCAIGGLQ